MHPIKEVTYMKENESQVEKLIDFTKKEETITYEKDCQCQCSCSTQTPFHIIGVKEPVSAPF